MDYRELHTDSEHSPLHLCLACLGVVESVDVRVRFVAQEDKCALISCWTLHESLIHWSRVEGGEATFYLVARPSGVGPYSVRSEVTNG